MSNTEPAGLFFKERNEMKKKAVFLATVLLLTSAGLTQAKDSKLGVTADVTYVSRYIWRGFDSCPNNHSAIQSSIDLDLYETGWGVNVWWSRANTSGFENNEEIDYTLHYGKSLFEGETHATDYEIGWTYYYYPDEPRKAADMQEVFLNLSWPDIHLAGLVPGYTMVCTWPSERESNVRDYGGWFHILQLGYDLTIPNFWAEAKEQVLHLSAETIYNDGAYGATHDWSHAVFGISTSFDLSSSLTYTSAFYYQSSWDDSVNTHDEHWTSLSITYRF
jgi:hypothetical protein